jgi:HAD superfamily hydrolase (TIGR01509 family)
MPGNDMQNRYGILFDLDGTLLDNEHLKARALADCVARFGGKAVPMLYADVMGRSMETIIDHFLKAGKIRIDPAEYRNCYNSTYKELLLSQLQLRTGAREFLKEIKARGLATALVSAGDRWAVSHILNALKLEPLLNKVVTKEDVTHQKPDPAIYCLALEKLSLTSAQAVAFEDSESGLRAARGAGIATICIRHEYNQKHDFSGAALVCDSFVEDREQIKEKIQKILKLHL